MLAAENNRPSRIVQSPPLPPNPKTTPNYSSPREPYLTRTNSKSNQRLKKHSAEKSIRQKKFEQDIKYALPTKI
jgi:phosphosulfolactate phosphohydrolase-like enzyme